VSPPSSVRSIWSVLREPLRTLTFAEMKEAAAASGLATAELSDLRQGSGGGGASKLQLADAIDGLFNQLGPSEQDRTTVYMVGELMRRCPPDIRQRMEELLERVGWQLVADDPVPLDLRLDVDPAALPPGLRDALMKGVRRYRDGDLDGAMTSIVGLVDMATEAIYVSEGLIGHYSDSYLTRAVKAHKTREAAFRTSLDAMEPGEATRTWEAQKRAVNGAADVLAAFRRNYSDAHGPSTANAHLVQAAVHSALLVVYSLLE
jgi:hypothetical protein